MTIFSTSTGKLPEQGMSRRGFLLGLATAPFLLPLSSPIAWGSSVTETQTRVIRLRPLQKLVHDSLRSGRLDRSALTLFGITRLDGFVVDEKNRDVLLFGQVDRRFPTLHLADLITAMRNVWLSPQEDPACSIDPRQEDLATVMKVVAEQGAASDARQMNGILKNLMTVCQRPNQVSIFGVPRTSLFAQTMVQADYHMKQVAAGIIPHPTGQKSFKDLGFAWMAAQAKRECGRVAQAPVVARFWFYPATPSYEQAQDIFAIKEVEVCLLTEEEHLKASGQRVQTGQSHPVADQFRRDFTSSYREAARKEAVFAELRNLYRFVALSIFLQKEKTFENAGLDLNFWLHEYPDERVATPEKLAGIAVVEKGQITCTSSRGTMAGILAMPMCGGVGVSKAILGDPSRVAAGGSRLEEMTKQALRLEPTPGHSLFWEARLPGIRFEDL